MFHLIQPSCVLSVLIALSILLSVASVPTLVTDALPATGV